MYGYGKKPKKKKSKGMRPMSTKVSKKRGKK